MLNDKGLRELAYVVKVTDVFKHPNADRLDIAQINGWRCIVGRDEIKKGDLAVYFEIDSKLPEKKPFTDMEFLASKHYKIKTQKLRGEISQGLLMSLEQLGLDPNKYPEGTFLTSELGVTYSVKEDNTRKNGDPNSKYVSMQMRHKKLSSKKWWKYLYKKAWGKKLLFLFFGKRVDNPLKFPTHFEFVHVTDEERVENMTWVLNDKSPLVLTEKLDGTSSTYILERKPFGKFEFYVTSRRVRMRDPNQSTYHQDMGSISTNIYWDMAHKYNIEEHLKDYLNENKDLKYVCIQGESVGSVQGNPLKLGEDRLYVFNFIRSDIGRISSIDGRKIIESWGMNWVPIIDDHYILPDDFEEFKKFADGKSAVNHNVLREGFVLRNPKTNLSFKNVSREYLMSKHE